MTVVAQATGPSVREQLEAPMWWLLYCFSHIQEDRHRQGLARRLERVDSGMMTALAFNQPAALADELQHVHDAIEAYERGPEDMAEEFAALRARGEALAARIAAGRVLSPEALLPS